MSLKLPIRTPRYRRLVLLSLTCACLSACGYVTAPAKHAVARSAQLGVKTYDVGVEAGEDAAIVVRDTAVVVADVTVDTSIKAAHAVNDGSRKALEVAGNTTKKVASAAKSSTLSGIEHAKQLPSKIKAAVKGTDDIPAEGDSVN